MPYCFQGHLSSLNITRLKKSSCLTQIGRFRTITPVFFTNGYEMMHKGWSTIEQVPYFLSRSSVKFPGHGAKKIVEFDPNWAFLDCISSPNSPMAKMLHKAWSSREEMPYCFWRSSINFKGHTAHKSLILSQIRRFWTVTPVWIHQWLRNDAKSFK